MQRRINDLTGHYIVCGLGDTGRHAVGELQKTNTPHVVVDISEENLNKLKELHPKMAVEGRTRVGSGEAYVVSAALADGNSEKFYFDAQSGLLVRDDLPVEIPDEGKTTQQSIFEDYKDVDGVKLPFTIRRLRPDGDSIIKLSEIKNNVLVDDNKFEKPPK